MSQRLPYVVGELHDVPSSSGGQDTQLLPFSAAVTTRRSKYGGPSERFPEIVTTRQTLKDWKVAQLEHVSAGQQSQVRDHCLRCEPLNEHIRSIVGVYLSTVGSLSATFGS
ncbi:hypothetical protein Tco_0830247 [Tanacetum coccineum]